MKWSDYFKNDIQMQDLSLEQKIEKLKLSEERVWELKQTSVKELTVVIENDYEMEYKVIDVDAVVGLARKFFDSNWLDVLSDKYCHKIKNFYLYNEDTFNSVLMNPPNNDYPEVYEVGKEYYIGGNGLHRLTIAKCVGGKKARVVAKKEI